MKREAAAISFIDNCILWLVSIVYDTVLAILYISVDFYIIIGGIPSVQFVLGRCRPENRTVEYTAVSEAVWKSADVNTAALSKGFYCHLNLMVILDQDLGFRKRKNILFALTEVHITFYISQNKVVSVFLPVVFIGI